jgi:hypothetical protein
LRTWRLRSHSTDGWGLALPEGAERERFVRLTMENGTMFWDTIFARAYDPARDETSGGYRVILEFLLADNAAVDARYEVMTGYGYHGRLPPRRTVGPYAATLEDPDGNTILLAAE